MILKKNLLIMLIMLISTLSIMSISTSNTTIFVHGTLLPYKAQSLPLDLYPASTSTIASILHKADFKLFARNKFYRFGWSGKLSTSARLTAGQKLYDLLKLVDDDKYIIAHSHGGNVVLHMAQASQKNTDTQFIIDKLILLGCPVIYETAQNASSTVFKKVYSFYSKRDMIQVLDPQGLRNYFSKSKEKIPFFSQRVFNDKMHIIQVQVKFNRKKHLGHLDFIKSSFLSALPEIIKTIDRTINETLKENMPFCFVVTLCPFKVKLKTGI